MANGFVTGGSEHAGQSPFEYSNREQLEYYDAIQSNFHKDVYQQTYFYGMNYSPLRYDDYAGIFVFTPPNPIILPSEPHYNGVAPMKLMPVIDPPYPYDLGINYDGY